MPGYSPTTVNFYDIYYVVRDDRRGRRLAGARPLRQRDRRRRACSIDQLEEQSMTEKRVPVRSYSTRFEHDEDPISEGGMWINGQTDGIDWIDCMTQNGGEVCGKVTRMTVAERRAEQVHDEAGDRRRRHRRRLRRPDGGALGRVGARTSTARRRCSAATRRTSTSRRSRSACAARSRRTAAPATRSSGGRSRPTRATPRSCAGTARSATSRRSRARSGTEFGVKDGDVVEASIEGRRDQAASSTASR